jgi:hypothetical protein
MKYTTLVILIIFTINYYALSSGLPKKTPVNKRTNPVYYHGNFNSHSNKIHSITIPHILVHRRRFQSLFNHKHTYQTLYLDFHSNARSFVSLARLAYCPKVSILSHKCSICSTVLNKYKTFFIHSINENKKRLFQFVILYSDKNKEVVITFSGPKTTQTKYFSKVYKKGFQKISILGNVNIEKYYWEIYSKYMRKALIKKIKKVIKSKRGSYKFIFVGHSFGGSFATLAAYDLVLNKILSNNKKIHSPTVYTYGLMRIGDNLFIKKVNSLFEVVRIVRSDDFVTRTPSCVYDLSLHRFRCYRTVRRLVKLQPIFKRYFVVYRRGVRNYRKKVLRRLQKNKVKSKFTHTNFHSYYSQPLGTLIYYSQNNFENYKVCRYISGIPICEKKIKLPRTFSPSVHAHYFHVNVELC